MESNKTFLPKIPSCRIWLSIFSMILMFLLVVLFRTNVPKARYEHLSRVARRALSRGSDGPPVLAYWILGSRDESGRMLRLLKAIYHPRNRYLLQLDSSSSVNERVDLAISTGEFGNVDVMGKSYGVDRAGPSGLAAMLHAAALLLRIDEDWDWFVPLTASDYPLFTQDDILYAFTSLPKDVNFVGFTNDTRQNVSQIVVDPSLYLKENTPMFYAAEAREKPDAFRIFGGSSSMILSRYFLEHCVKGWDNLPRKLLMYFSNAALPLESYFQTIICNTPEFENTRIVNNNLMHNVVQNLTSNLSRSDSLMEIQAIFAGPFKEDDPELKEIDEQLLKRDPDMVEQGKCCRKTGLMNETVLGSNNTSTEELCSTWRDIDCLDPGVRGVSLRSFLSRLVREKRSTISLCESHVLKNGTNE